MCEFSSGDSSPCDDDQYQAKIEFIGTKLSIRDICNSVLNSNCYEIRILEPTKTGKYEKIPLEWQDQKDIILFYYDSSLEACQDKHSIKKYLKEKFKDYHFINFEEVQKVYLAGEQAYVIRINEVKSAQFFYYNMNKNQPKHKKYLGENFQVGILKKIRDVKIQYKIILRFLPIQFYKEKIESIIYERRNEKNFIDIRSLRVEELFECTNNKCTLVEGCKYGVIYCDDLKQSQSLVDIFNKYFFERKISQPEIILVNEEGKKVLQISNTSEFINPLSTNYDTENQMKLILQQEIDKEIQEKIEKQERLEKLERQEKQERLEKERLEKIEKEKNEKIDREKEREKQEKQQSGKKNYQDINLTTVEFNSGKVHEKQEKSIERNQNSYHSHYHHNYNNKYENGSRNKGRRSRSQSRKRRHSSSDSSKKYHDRKHRQNRYETKRKSGWENNSSKARK
ncbi:unnamed protein product (macronuclear) [Paramecium tetraurelia]|uniref:Uncharacterized protein n=1 Tax=Paramecium tetraurelia TaxID=5888 RepID=A0D8G4_PARTE|nr:uncharacterized protein GSPATT00014277001 [Paramecium tetraurelia]CAK79331.1 unnamed protein product [Paramecium tetraurelia]|eukprot:XP_001446728.1 hypothetical protein (macronuclear) [Paramecium tetraurelia strain d4-2]